MRYGSLICSKKWLSERPNWRGMFLRLEGETVLDWCENMSCFSLSGCHMAVSQSWAGYHTSFERGESGLPADMKIRTIAQLIGILWSYFGMLWGLPKSLNILVCLYVTSCTTGCPKDGRNSNMPLFSAIRWAISIKLGVLILWMVRFFYMYKT